MDEVLEYEECSNLESEHEYYTLSQIEAIKDIRLRLEMLQLYKESLKKWDKDRVAKRVISSNFGASIVSLRSDIDDFSLDNMCAYPSSYASESDVVIVYPRLSLVTARKDTHCDFCSSMIFRGSKYYIYRPLLENLSKGTVYVLDPSIKVHEIEAYSLPKNVVDFDDFQMGLKNGRESGMRFHGTSLDQISHNLGGELRFKQLRRTRK